MNYQYFYTEVKYHDRLYFQQESKLEYAAAVVEYRPSNETDPIRYAEDNTKVYIEVIQSNETALADIIVFPEATLNRQSHPAKLPKAGDEVAPCDTNEFSDIIKNISCAARQSNKYVVINLYMQRNCKDEADETNDPRPCSRGDLNIYNTAVAFDRNGTVVAMYTISQFTLPIHINMLLILDVVFRLCFIIQS